MTKRILWFATVPALLLAGAAIAQYPIMNAVADKVVQNYTSSRHHPGDVVRWLRFVLAVGLPLLLLAGLALARVPPP